jgi:hypothetical protein
MRPTLIATFVSGLLLAVGVPARADDAAARQLIDKATQAVGGEAELSKWKGAAWRSKGTFHAKDATLSFTAAWDMQWPDKARVFLETEVAGMKVNYTLVLDGNKGWIKINDREPTALGGDRLAEETESMHHELVTRLLVLKDKAYTLSLLPEIKIAGKPAAGVKVVHQGHRDIQLFFDKNSSLLVKSAVRVKTERGEEVNQETIFTDYQNAKDKKGEKVNLKVAMKVLIQRDGQPYVTMDLADYTVVEKLEDKLFEKP